MAVFNFALLIVFAILVAVFAVANSQAVAVNFIFVKSSEVSLSLVILFSILAGVIFAIFLFLYSYLKMKWDVWALEKENVRLEDKIIEYEEYLRDLDSGGKEKRNEQE